MMEYNQNFLFDTKLSFLKYECEDLITVTVKVKTTVIKLLLQLLETTFN